MLQSPRLFVGIASLLEERHDFTEACQGPVRHHNAERCVCVCVGGALTTIMALRRLFCYMT